MKTKNTTLIYTKDYNSFPGRYQPFWDKENSTYRLVSEPGEFRSSLNISDFDSVIIDSNSDLSPATLLDLISRSTRKGIPVVITDLQAEKQTNLRKHLKRERWLRSRLVLRKKWPDPSLLDQNNLHLVTETAATLCHEINNPLMAITANIEVLLEGNNHLPAEVIEKVKLVGQAADRIKDATEKLICLDSLSYKDTVAGRMINLENSGEQQRTSLYEIDEQ